MRLSVIVLLCAVCANAAWGQELELLFETVGRPALIFDDTAGSEQVLGEENNLFPTGLLLARENDDGLLTGIQTMAVETHEVIWRMEMEWLDSLFAGAAVRLPDSRCENEEDIVFLGLVNLAGNGTRYPVFAGLRTSTLPHHDGILIVDPHSTQRAFEAEIDGATPCSVRATDVTGDGIDELVAFAPETHTVRVFRFMPGGWGDGSNHQLFRDKP